MGMQQAERERSGRDRIETALLLSAIAAVLVFAITVPLELDPSIALIMNSFGFSLPFLLIGIQLSYHALRMGFRHRAWGLVAVSMFALAGSNFFYVSQANAGLSLDISDELWVLSFLPMVVGVAMLVRPITRGEGWVSVLDAVVVSLGVFTVAIAVLSEVLEAAHGLPASGALNANLLEVLADDVLLAIALGAVHASRWRPPSWIWLVLAAAAVFATSDAAYLVQLSYGDYVQGELVDLGWVLSALLFGIAAFTRANGGDAAGPPRRWGSNMQTLVPAVLIPAAAVALVLDSDGALGLQARTAGLCAVTLSGVRLFVAVREQRLLTEELREARIDPLTGLPNLRGLRSLPKRSLDGSVLLTVDLEGLGDINATLGTAFGDRVLINVSDRIALAMRNDDLLARIDGDEFGVLLRRASTHTGARVAELLVSEIEAEMPMDGHIIRVSACVGVSSVAAGAGFDLLLLEAQDALHEAKRSGTGLVRSFAGAAGIQSQERLRLRAEIKTALRGDSPAIVPYFQPIVSLLDGTLMSVEALARWKHEGQILLPAAFMQEVEQSDSMRTLTALMLETSLLQLRSAGVDVAVTVNVPADLVDDMLPHLVRGALSESGSSPDQLIVEVTEEAIMRNASMATQALDDLRSNGVKVLLDDFGTGWSGLSTLRDLAVDGLKIDGSFTRAMESDATTRKIVASVATLAAQLGVLVIYEGVEDPAQLRRLQTIGEGLVQGFAVAHPMPVDELVRWISRDSDPSAGLDAQVDGANAEVWE
jgi:diguanylate cyclase (GGDEF)-like protein